MTQIHQLSKTRIIKIFRDIPHHVALLKGDYLINTIQYLQLQE